MQSGGTWYSERPGVTPEAHSQLDGRALADGTGQTDLCTCEFSAFSHPWQPRTGPWTRNDFRRIKSTTGVGDGESEHLIFVGQ
jgi:hypothetical protein